MRANYNILILFIICLIFILSANIAWFNPKPGFHVYKIFKDFPLFWQYTIDAPMELLSGAYFPEYFEVNKIRVPRPGYPILIYLISKVVGLLSMLFIDLTQLYKAGISFLLIKFSIYLLSAKMLFELVKKFSNNKIAIISTYLIFFHYHLIFYATTFHTTELNIITPIIVSYFFVNLKDNYTLTKNILFSFITGYLILCKPNYAIYFSLLSLSLLNKEFLKVAISFLSHLLPIILYLIFLKLVNIEFSHVGFSDFKYFQWIFIENPSNDLLTYINIILISLTKSFLIFFNFFYIFSFLFIIGLIVLIKKYKRRINLLIFIILFTGFTWLQVLTVNRWEIYEIADLSILVFPISIVMIILIFKKFIMLKLRKPLTLFLLVFYGLFMISTFVHLPWVHPYEQLSQEYDVDEFKIQDWEIRKLKRLN